ncbi:MAG: hypothetical protein MI866_09715 [Bacteroidales bacterium]|nr:hypothetical protein [Bacteroidales bacterium]
MNQLVIDKIKTSAAGEVLFPVADTAIANDNWNYPADVKVMFGMAYDSNNFYLKYQVEESHPKAVCTQTNGPVWEDSCVEFFIAFNNKEYYNLEFNCIGTRLAGLGTSNTDRQWLNADVVETIITKPSLGSNPVDLVDTPTTWEMDIIIPKTVFGNSVDSFEAGNTFKVNFYKCGDKQKQMHFLSWNAIDNETPNFHLPQFFGEVTLK